MDKLESKIDIIEKKISSPTYTNEECNFSLPISSFAELTSFEELLQEEKFQYAMVTYCFPYDFNIIFYHCILSLIFLVYIHCRIF